MAAKSTKQKYSNPEIEGNGRKYLSQSDVPSFSLEAAQRVPAALSDNFGKMPTKPLRVAQAMNLSPNSSNFRVICGAAIAYGLVDGGANSEQIALTALGKRIVAPTKEGDDLAARREAILRPRVIQEFLTRYNGSRLPTEAIGRNVLEELGTPADKAAAVFALIIESAKSVGFLRDVKGQQYVDLDTSPSVGIAIDNNHASALDVGDKHENQNTSIVSTPPQATSLESSPGNQAPTVNQVSRVFITHGKNQDIVNQLKELLSFGNFIPVVAKDNETVSKPVPDKVLDEMRTCHAAVIHVGSEIRLLDNEGREHRILNQNVLIEIGAAQALYGRKFILLVESGVTLPSNLQGLYEVRYEGGKLDYESTMKLLKAFNDFRT